MSILDPIRPSVPDSDGWDTYVDPLLGEIDRRIIKCRRFAFELFDELPYDQFGDITFDLPNIANATTELLTGARTTRAIARTTEAVVAERRTMRVTG